MNQAEVHKLISALRFKVSPKAYNIKGRRNPATTVPSNNGNRYRLELLRTQVTNLIVNERLELVKHTGITVREYTERLIQEAINNGDTHRPTMELADWWLEDKAAIHKLFKVIVPRMKDQPFAYTRLFNSPIQASANKEGQDPMMKQHRPKVIVPRMKDQPFAYTSLFNSPIQASANKEGQDPMMKQHRPKVIVELVGHPFPPLYYSNQEPNRKMIHNVLLAEARREYRLQQKADQRQELLTNTVKLEDEVD